MRKMKDRKRRRRRKKKRRRRRKKRRKKKRKKKRGVERIERMRVVGKKQEGREAAKSWLGRGKRGR